MLASHTLILVFVGLQGAAIWFLRPLPLAGAVLMSGFELFAALIQAFIFTMLTAIYIREATETHG
jgi:F-type H+-transporting ATPase subunit a